jgi:IS30 family transposase
MGESRGRWHHLTDADQLEVLEGLRAGATLDAVAEAAGCSRCTVQRLVARTGGLKPRVVPRSALRLSLAEREEISRGVVAGESCRSIARRLARAPSTISRELIAGSTSQGYRAWRADMTAHERAHRPKPAKLRTCLRLRLEVERGLRRRWSPEQIATRLVRDFPTDLEMRVSHETIYQSLFVQSRGVFRTELTRYLRTGRSQRRAPGQMNYAGHLKDMVSISARPAEIEDRAVPGHGEGDLLLGRRGQSAIATLVERQTRLVLLVRLPKGRSADAVKNALMIAVKSLPVNLRRSLTWDRGKEMAAHVPFTIASGVQVYFCDPHSPWQRGTNENTNGLLRQYFPKATDFSVVTQAQLTKVAVELNGRPRQTLDWQTPSEAFARVVAMTV